MLVTEKLAEKVTRFAQRLGAPFALQKDPSLVCYLLAFMGTKHAYDTQK